MTLEELAARCEAADASEQRALLIEAWGVLNPRSMCWDFDEGEAHYKALSRFAAMLNAEAYESAAMMLVPEGWEITLTTDGGVRVSLHNHAWMMAAHGRSPIRGKAATPALALTAACLRAKGLTQ